VASGEPLTTPKCCTSFPRTTRCPQTGGRCAWPRCSSKTSAIFALITNTLAKDKEIEDRGAASSGRSPREPFPTSVEDEVVDALIARCAALSRALSHRYYRLKAKWFGVERLDCLGSQCTDCGGGRPHHPVGRRRSAPCLRRIGAFSDELATIGSRFFTRSWIDAPVRPGKAPGAFAHPTLPSVHPYLLAQLHGQATRRHDLWRTELATASSDPRRCPGRADVDTPLTLAETASVFGECWTFRALLAAERDPSGASDARGKVEDMRQHVVRQIAFVEFRARVHDERRAAELTPDRINGDLARGATRRASGRR